MSMTRRPAVLLKEAGEESKISAAAALARLQELREEASVDSVELIKRREFRYQHLDARPFGDSEDAAEQDDEADSSLRL